MIPRLILGIGNIILRDEGVGVRIIERMRDSHVALPPNVEIVDGGTSGADLIDVIADREKVVVIDAVQLDAEPGTVVRFTGDDLVAEAVVPISLHQFGLVDTLMMASKLNCLPKQTIVFGIKPKDIRPGLDLSPEIEALVPKVIELALAEVQRP
ncbi:MAG: HyaD/HybD family hydrogenase maturation endopeptidase [Phycisphaerae bacterium]|nr:HyaD/HybD family hydrogenase maturation endopeptidase [Phycisphaerae bacterium]